MKQSNDLIRLRYVTHVQDVRLKSKAEITKLAVTYVDKYMGTKQEGDIQACVKKYSTSSPDAVEGSRITALGDIPDESVDAEKIYRQRTLFGDEIQYCGTDKDDVLRVLHESSSTGLPHIDVLEGNISIPADRTRLGTTIGALESQTIGFNAILEAFETAEAAVRSDARAITGSTAKARADKECDQYLRSWGELPNEVKFYILARMAGFEDDPMMEAIGGHDAVRYTEVTEVTVTCKVDPSTHDFLRRRTMVEFLDSTKQDLKVGAKVTVTDVAAYGFDNVIEIPALLLDNQYYIDYRPHRAAIKGLYAYSTSSIASSTQREIEGIDNVRAAELFAPDKSAGNLVGDDVYLRTESEPKSTTEVIARLTPGKRWWNNTTSFKFVADYHQTCYEYYATKMANTVNASSEDKGTHVSVMGYPVPFQVIGDDSGDDSGSGTSDARACFAPMKAHRPFTQSQHAVHGTSAPHTTKSIVDSLRRPSQRNVIGMALQAIQPGKPGDVILYDTT